jgi:2-methylcitrate dehydratase PrpD
LVRSTISSGDYANLTVTETLVDFVINLKYTDLPQEAVGTAKLCLLDSLGCGLGGYRTALGKAIGDQVGEMGGAKQATMLGYGLRVPCAQAAFANSAMINALDYDETFDAVGHPGSTLIPAALAVGEHLMVSGRDLILAMVAAYEISIRIGAAIQPSPERMKEVWFVGTWQTFGAVAAAGKLLQLDSLEMANAFGIAGVTSPLPDGNAWGPRPQHWAKEPTEWPAHSGVLAAQLAKRGFIGNRAVLDGDHGFWRMAGSDRCDFDTMVRELGTGYLLPKMAFKPYPSCRWTHSTLDAVKEIVENRSLTPDRIEQVIVKTFPQHTTHLIDYEPVTLVDGEFSTPYTVAMVLAGVKPGPQWYSDRNLRNPRILSLAKRVRVEVDEEAEKMYFRDHKMVSTVEILTKDGKRFVARKDFAKGDPENPFTRDELIEKFQTLASQTLPSSKAKKLASFVERIHTAKDISDMAKYLRP